jgi:hypothetical protein
MDWLDGRWIIYDYECPCPLLKDITEPVPKEWCWCTLAACEAIYRYAVERPVKGKLLGSIKMGDARCAVELTVGPRSKGS